MLGPLEMTKLPPEINPKLARKIADAMIAGAFTAGYLTDSDLEDADLVFKKLYKLLRSRQIDIIVDHRKTVLDAAISYQNEGNLTFSVLFYATFFEHSINYLISEALKSKRKPQKMISAVIRTANIEAKFGWLMDLLELPKFSDKHRKTILAVASERNSFVHYKWDPRPVDVQMSEAESERISALLNLARGSATYVRGYESRYLFRNRKHKVAKVTGGRPENSSKPTPLRGVT